MALEAAIFPQDPFGYGCEDLIYSLGGGGDSHWSYDFGLVDTTRDNLKELIENLDTSCDPCRVKEWELNSSPETCAVELGGGGGRRKRRRTKSRKNQEELENQRMTHIAVERNRRKQMNEYLAVLRSLMPSSYAQRGDQASIVGGAINFVKELEQLLQTMEANKRSNNASMTPSSPFANFFTFPQYSTRAAQCNSSSSPSSSAASGGANAPTTSNYKCCDHTRQWSAADIEVSMVEAHAHIKILSKKQPKQLLKMVAAFQSLRFSILHLNVTTTADQMVLYSVNVKVEEGSRMSTVDEIAGAVNDILRRIQEEAEAINQDSRTQL